MLRSEAPKHLVFWGKTLRFAQGDKTPLEIHSSVFENVRGRESRRWGGRGRILKFAFPRIERVRTPEEIRLHHAPEDGRGIL